MHEAKPVVASVGHRGEVERLAVEPGERAGVGVVVTGQRLDQRRLAAAVLADERVDLAGRDLEGDVAQRPRAAEGLGQLLEPEHRLRALLRPSLTAGLAAWISFNILSSEDSGLRELRST